MRKVRVAVAGCGKVSEKYIPHLQQSAGVEVVAVCDPVVERVQRQAQVYGIEHAFQDIDQMLT
jgi:predicted dehydrogenase